MHAEPDLEIGEANGFIVGAHESVETDDGIWEETQTITISARRRSSYTGSAKRAA